jgi:uncharacterized damage-inducible protein DinB
MSSSRRTISWIEAEFERYKKMGERTIGQLSDEQLLVRASPESNSIAMIVWHMAGNLESRFTDFLTTDGEKPWRNRESEFEERRVSRSELLAKGERGWKFLLDALGSLADSDLDRTVRIRGEELTVGQALVRALAHATYHVGQMTFYGKVLRGEAWEWLTIPPGQSAAFEQAARARGRG